MKKKVLVVGLHLDDTRQSVKRINKLPQGVGAAFLAGAFDPEHCEIKVYSESASGPLEDRNLLGWPDMLVMTGLNVCFDRMLHLTAYARTLNPRVIVVAGGPPIRILTRYSTRFFDYCCTGDIEQLQDVVREAWGPEYAAREMYPRLDLAYWLGICGHAETTRYCNFACSFCSLTAENNRYRTYDLDYLRRQIEMLGKRVSIHFVDNNFYGNDRNHFAERVKLIGEYHRKGYYRNWTALLTNDFYLKDENLKLVRENGCVGFFTGVESFDQESLRNYNKTQNMRLPQVDLFRRSLTNGLVVYYGLFMDVYNRTLEDLRGELDFIAGNDEIMLPGFITLPIPLVGTPYFNECLRENKFLPGTRLRDLDGTTLSMRPRDDFEEVIAFVREIQHLRPYRRRIIRHGLRFYRRYRKHMGLFTMAMALVPNGLITFNKLLTSNPLSWAKKGPERTHVSGSDPLDPCFTPAMRVDSRFESYFEPTPFIDAGGELNPDLAEDLLRTEPREKAIHQGGELSLSAVH